MKILKLLALSDLHLGERESVLFNSGDRFNLIDTTINKIIELSSGDDNFNSGIEQLILIGDIIELSEATDEEAYANTKFFLTSLLNKVKIDKIVYILIYFKQGNFY
jgi:metallophosphoesterase superfamily enzyme